MNTQKPAALACVFKLETLNVFCRELNCLHHKTITCAPTLRLTVTLCKTCVTQKAVQWVLRRTFSCLFGTQTQILRCSCQVFGVIKSTDIWLWFVDGETSEQYAGVDNIHKHAFYCHLKGMGINIQVEYLCPSPCVHAHTHVHVCVREKKSLVILLPS